MKLDFVTLQISYMKQILEASFQRLHAPLEKRGVWYAIDYFQRGGAIDEEGAAFHGLAPNDFFATVSDPTSPSGKRIYTFATRKGKKPSESLQKLLAGLSFLDCGFVCYFAASLALCTLIGRGEFDRLYDPEGENRFIIAGDQASSVSSLIERHAIESEEEIERGDIVYFSNCKEYVAKHPAGEARGFNVICAETRPHKYLGFGLPGEALTREEIEKNLWRSFNKDPVDESFYPPKIWDHLYSKMLLCDREKSRELVAQFKGRVLSWEEYQKRPGRMQSGTDCMGKLALWVYRPIERAISLVVGGC